MSNQQNDHFYETVKENTSGKEDVYTESIADNYPLYKELEKMDNNRFIQWLQEELN